MLPYFMYFMGKGFESDVILAETRARGFGGAQRTACRSPARPKCAATKPISSLQSRLNNLHVPASPLINAEDAAALAGRAFDCVASNFLFRVGGCDRSESWRSRSGEVHRGLDGKDVAVQASRVLLRGIGWFLGAADES
jgi:hypothetical protein